MFPRSIRHAAVVLLCAWPGVARPAVGQAQAAPAPDTLRLADALGLALARNPALRAADFRAEAAAERVGPAGALPDPQLQVGLMNRMAGDLGSTADPMTMNQFQLMQMLPFPGKLARAREAARHQASAVASDALEQRRALAGQVRSSYFALAYTDRALDALRRSRTLLLDLARVATTLYSVGGGLQQDVLRAQIEVARMDEDIATSEQERVAGAARLNAFLGREAMVPIGGLELPADTLPLPPTDSLVALALGGRAAIQAGTERIAAADAALGAAKRERLPDFQVGVAYQQRPAYPDMASLMLGVSLPIFPGRRQVPLRREMAAMQGMAQAEQLDLRNETTAEVVEARARAERDRILARLYQDRIVPQARAAVQSALAAYQVGKVDFATLVDDQLTVTRYEIETWRLRADQEEAKADLATLTGALP